MNNKKGVIYKLGNKIPSKTAAKVLLIFNVSSDICRNTRRLKRFTFRIKICTRKIKFCTRKIKNRDAIL